MNSNVFVDFKPARLQLLLHSYNYDVTCALIVTLSLLHV